MPSEARQKKIVEKLNRAQKCSILGPQNLGSGGGARAPGAPLDPHLIQTWLVLLQNLIIWMTGCITRVTSLRKSL